MPELALTSGLAENVERVARAAGRVILEQAERARASVRRKEDHSPVTDADLAAHHLIADAIAGLAPGIAFLSEEDAEAFGSAEPPWFWAVDPLDGTEEFLRGGSEYCVNIALVREGVPVLGVVHQPESGVSWVGVEGARPWRCGADGVAAPVAGVRAWHEGEPLLLLTSRWHRSRRLMDLLASLPPHTTAARGAALKIVHLTDGEAHAAVSAGGTRVWDTAAGDAILRLCGAHLRAPSGEPLRCSAQDRVNPAWVASASDALVPGRPLI